MAVADEQVGVASARSAAQRRALPDADWGGRDDDTEVSTAVRRAHRETSRFWAAGR
jgi:hypothetical protein